MNKQTIIAISAIVLCVSAFTFSEVSDMRKREQEKAELVAKEKAQAAEEARQDAVVQKHGATMENWTKHPSGAMRYGFDIAATGPISDAELVDIAKSVIRKHNAGDTTSMLMFFRSPSAIGKESVVARVVYGPNGKWSGGSASDPMDYSVEQSWTVPNGKF